MFSLIITIISIALVAALALATLYYGGTAFNQGRAEAEASKIIIQGQQVLAAADLYYVQRGTWPTFAQMLANGYLESIPIAQGGAVGAAMAANQPWAQVKEGVPVYALVDVENDTCRMVNKQAYKLDGILPNVLTAFSAQCYGPGPTALKVVVAKNGTYLLEAGLDDTALLPTVDVSTGALPPSTEEGSWTVLPGAVVVAGGGTGPDPDPASTLPEGTDAAACLSFTTGGALTYTPDGAYAHSENFGMYSGCSRPLVVRAVDGDWDNTMFYSTGYQASVGGAGTEFVPTVNLSLMAGHGDVTVSESGELSFELSVGLYGGPPTPYVSRYAAPNELVGMYASLYTGSGGGFRLTNTIQFEVKFADEPDTAFVPDSLSLSGTIPASPAYTCDPMTYSCESVSGSGGGD